MDCVQIISVAKDIALGLAAITGSVVAVMGLGTWKRQNKGQLEYDLSRRILVGLFKYRDAINHVRHPAMLSSEMPIPPEDELKSMKDDQIHFYGVSNAYQARWDRVRVERTALYADLLEAEAIWGNELECLFKTLFTLENELFRSISRYVSLINPATSEHTKDAVHNISQKNRDIMYDDLSDNGDEYKNEFRSGVERVEKFLKSKLIR